jgi:hypothetical protein
MCAAPSDFWDEVEAGTPKGQFIRQKKEKKKRGCSKGRRGHEIVLIAHLSAILPRVVGMKRGAWHRTVEVIMWYTMNMMATARFPGCISIVGAEAKVTL